MKAPAYSFGPFLVDVARRRVWKDGEQVALSPKPFDVLMVLLERADRVVTKDELLLRVWPDTVVQENNLARQIATLRRILERACGADDLIVTIPGRGYQFVATVTPLSSLPEGWFAPSRPVPDVATAEADAGSFTSSLSTETSRRGRLTVALAASAFLGLAVAVPWLVTSVAPPAAVAQRTLRRITFDDGSVPRQAAWAPDGRWLVYVSDRSGGADIWKQRIGDPDPIQLTVSDAVESQPVWSPDGQSIAFRSETDGGGLFVMSADGGAIRQLTSFGYGPTWSSDGSQILFKRSVTIPDQPSGYFVVALDGGEPKSVRPDVLDTFSSLHATWHVDADMISVWGSRADGTGREVLAVPLAGGEPISVAMTPEVRRRLADLVPARFVWGPSGRHVYFEALAQDTRNIWRVSVDPSSGMWISGPDRLTTGTVPESDVAISPDGSRVLFTTTSSRTGLWAFPFDAAEGRVTGDPFSMSRGSAGEVDFDADPSGLRVAYRAVRAGRHELWEKKVAGGEDRLLSTSLQPIVRPVWSPDGARLAFSRKTIGGDDVAIGVVNLDGTGERYLTEPDAVEMHAYDWSKDGTRLVGPCRSNGAGRYSLCVVRADDAAHDIRVVAADVSRNLFNPRFSPDGRWISFLAHDLSRSATSTVFVAPIAGGGWRAVTDGDWFDDKPRWAPDGRVVYFVSNRDGVANVWGRRFDPVAGAPIGPVFRVTRFSSARFQITRRTVSMEIAVTPRHLILPMTDARSEIWMLEGVDR